jgi:hypothetical protein
MNTDSMSGVTVDKRRVKRKRSKALTLMLLPALIFIGGIGWLMYALGPRHSSKPKQRQKVAPAKKNDENKDDGITFEPTALYQEEEITQ